MSRLINSFRELRRESKKDLLLIVFLSISALVITLIAVSMLVYTPQYVIRVLAWRDSDAFDWQKFPSHTLHAAPNAFHFETAPDPKVEKLLADLADVQDWNSFLAENKTQAFIVIQDGKILYENYFNDTNRNSIVTSFSVAKSF